MPTEPTAPEVVLLKDFAGPAVSLIVALIFFWLVPRRQHKQDLAIDFFKMYNSSEMKTDRKAAWTYLHPIGCDIVAEERVAEAAAKSTEAAEAAKDGMAESVAKVKAADDAVTTARNAAEAARVQNAEQTRAERMKKIVEWTITTPPGANLEGELDNLQSVLRVFNFFGACEDCLRTKQVDTALFKSLLAFSFDRWASDICAIAEKVALEHSNQNSKAVIPTWASPMTRLTALCETPTIGADPKNGGAPPPAKECPDYP